MVKNSTKVIFLMVKPDKSSLTIADQIEELGLAKMRIWRLHSDRDRSFLGHRAAELEQKQIVSTDTGEVQPCVQAENAIGRPVHTGRCLMLQGRGTPDLWDTATQHAVDITNRTKGAGGSISPLEAEIEDL